MKVLDIHRVRFGAFEFDRLNRLLYRDGAELSLPPRAVGVLSCLLDRPGQVVPKQVLLDEVWKDANVTETSLTEAVSLLRQVLIDDPQRPTFIQTIPRRGYRFVAPAEVQAASAGTATAVEALSLAPATAPHAPADAAIEEPAWPAWLPWMFLAVSFAVLGGIIVAVMRQPSTYTRPVVRFVVDLPAGLELAGDAPALALSRNGQRLAFVARRATDGLPRLYVRDMDRLDAVLLEGTDGASAPFFSPDARWVGFFAGGSLKKVPAGGGAVVTLCEARAPGGAAWSTRRAIIFAGSLTGGLSRVHEEGGAPTPLTTPDAAAGEVRHAWPDLLPDDAGVVFTGVPLAGSPEASRVAALAFDTGRVQTLVDAGLSPHYALTGHLLFARDRTIVAAPFDPETLELLGPAVPVLDNVATHEAAGVAQFVLAPGGHAAAVRVARPETTATYRWVRIAEGAETTPPSRAVAAGASVTRPGVAEGVAEPRAELAPHRSFASRGATDRHGATAAARAPAQVHAPANTPSGAPSDAVLIAPFPAREIRSVALSPDARRLAVSLGDGHRTDLWVSDLARRGDLQRLTNDGQNVAPAWTADGRRLIYAARRDGPFALFSRTLDDAAAAGVPLNGVAATMAPPQFPTSTSSDGLVYVDVEAKTGLDLWFLPWNDGRARPLVQTPFDETFGVISPDGRWLAYQSNESGSWTVMVRARGEAAAGGPEGFGDTTPANGRGSTGPGSPGSGNTALGSTAPRNAAPGHTAPGNAAPGHTGGDGVRIAESDGSQVAWSPDSRHLLFTRDGRLLQATRAVSKQRAPTWTSDGPPRVLATDIDPTGGFGVAADGRVLIRRRDASPAPARLEVVLDWSRELSAKVPIRPRTPRPVR